ncbi:hypothetical protein ACIHCQ_41420 [Streptomyces sp. NPDC052236]|uniref:hypothetical protein n=1 Tax=Streptomyces sp. NPDC052236 TaxID=3365686 RepID=UPI0037D6BD4B
MAVLSTPGTASAAPAAVTAKNIKTQYLTDKPTGDMPNSCVERRIYLASGNYDWGHVRGSTDTVVRPNLYLGAGWYTWGDCLDPAWGGYYIHSTWLDPDNPDWKSINITSDLEIPASGAWTWGSFLDPRF